MSDLKQAIAKVAQSNPEFAKALTAELQKEARTDKPIIHRPSAIKPNGFKMDVTVDLEEVGDLIAKGKGNKAHDSFWEFDLFFVGDRDMGTAGKTERIGELSMSWGDYGELALTLGQAKWDSGSRKVRRDGREEIADFLTDKARLDLPVWMMPKMASSKTASSKTAFSTESKRMGDMLSTSFKQGIGWGEGIKKDNYESIDDELYDSNRKAKHELKQIKRIVDMLPKHPENLSLPRHLCDALLNYYHYRGIESGAE